MLMTLHDHSVIPPLLNRKAINLEQLYYSDGRRVEGRVQPGVGKLMVVTSDLSKSTQIYLTAIELFAEMDTCYKVLSKVLSDEDAEHFNRVMEELVCKLSHIAEHHFDLAYAYMSWHASDDYPVMHHLIVALTLARTGQMSGRFGIEHLHSLMKAALTMNLSMLALQARLRSQTEPLSREQKEAIRKHPERSFNKLQLLGVTDPVWLETVQLHHELPDGSGYPLQIKNQDEGSVLLGICDSFNARMALREYRTNFTAEQAVQDLFAQGNNLVSDFASLLLEGLGIYPPGSLVQLEGNLIACSLLRGQSAVSPVVLAFRNLPASSQHFMLVDSDQEGYAVKNSLPRRDQGKLPPLLELLSKVA